jgi:hypothetical protein
VSSPSPIVPDPDTGAPPPRSPTPERLEAWPARLGAPPGLFKAICRPLDRLPGTTRALAAKPSCVADARNPNPRRHRFPLSTLPRRQGARIETRKEVSRPSVPLVGVPVHPVALEPSPEFFGRAAAPCRRSAALQPLLLPRLNSLRRALRLGASCASNHALEPVIGFAGELTAPRRSSPTAACRSHVSCAAGSRSSDLDPSAAAA